MKRSKHIVANGAEIIRGSEAYRRQVEEIRLQVTMRYAREYEQTSWLGKRLIDFKIWREVSGAADPRHRLYAKDEKKS